jgi:hypothetical protein
LGTSLRTVWQHKLKLQFESHSFRTAFGSFEKPLASASGRSQVIFLETRNTLLDTLPKHMVWAALTK